MRNPSRRFALVYAAIVLLVCLSVIAGPAGGGVISNLNLTLTYATGNVVIDNNIATFSGNGTVDPFSFSGVLDATNPNLVVMSATIQCIGAVDCSQRGMSIPFSFVGTGYPTSQQFQFSWVGSSTGAVESRLFIRANPGTVRNEATWQYTDIDLSQSEPGNFSLTSSPFVLDLITSPEGSFYLEGQLGIWSMAAGTTLSIPGGSSADISITAPDAPGVPEPSSALLLLGGFGLLEFLRRKVRG
jgi:hypothetical protein